MDRWVLHGLSWFRGRCPHYRINRLRSSSLREGLESLADEGLVDDDVLVGRGPRHRS